MGDVHTTAGSERTRGFEFLGGSLCFDFVNTVSWGEDGPREERLGSHRDLLAWARAAGLRPGARWRPAGRSAAAAADRAADASAGVNVDAGASAAASTRALRRALELRAALHAVFLAEAEGRRASPAEAAALGTFVEQAAAHLTLAPEPDVWNFRFDPADHSESLLWPVAWDAARLLTTGDRPAVRRCANDRCRWLFLDTSRRGNRRWCDMAVCGSRAKARRYYRRRRAKGERPTTTLAESDIERRFRDRAGRGSVDRGSALLDMLETTEVGRAKGNE